LLSLSLSAMPEQFVNPTPIVHGSLDIKVGRTACFLEAGHTEDLFR
jgi:hypothetical protein